MGRGMSFHQRFFWAEYFSNITCHQRSTTQPLRYHIKRYIYSIKSYPLVQFLRILFIMTPTLGHIYDLEHNDKYTYDILLKSNEEL